MSFIIPQKNLSLLFEDFAKFIKEQSGSEFKSFQTSSFIKYQENYKYRVSKEAKEVLDQKHWKESDIGTGKIQEKVTLAIQDRLHYDFEWHDNNLIDWRKKDNFSKLLKNKLLEQVIFDFYKFKMNDHEAFDKFLELGVSYQFIAYLFFIKDSNRFLPITQERFDQIFAFIGIPEFKTSRQASWENYTTFININKQVQDFLKTKDQQATLIDAHSFLYILGSQMKDANFPFPNYKHVQDNDEEFTTNENKEQASAVEINPVLAEEDDEDSFPEGKEFYKLHKSKERNNDVVKLAKERHFKRDEKLSCQICDFSFIETYGELGYGFIEAHHIFPISELKEETLTKVEDLLLVCSNCHRMLHRERTWEKIEDLKKILKKNNA